MANDPNKDLFPVREDNYKPGRGSNERMDYQILSKLSRCELEDRCLRLLDEQTHLKKLVNCQEEKIKRLGTKLLRIIGEKKSGGRSTEQSKETEDLQLHIMELEHENYALKDKNTVLKQQLASHSRSMTTHRSPVRSTHTSPLMSVRQPSQYVHNEGSYESGIKNSSTEAQLKEAEAHIKELNEEIKSLHCKIDYLQQNMERSSLDNRKTKVIENIELIRLQRSLKQQAIQIAGLQAQVTNSENNQKKLKEELTRAHNENDEALQVISGKQNEILTLCTKLEEKNLSRLEEDELRERIKDLMLERDCLKERSDFLMKSIGAKIEEKEKINELKKMLCEERQKKEKVEEALEAVQKCVINLKEEINNLQRNSERQKETVKKVPSQENKSLASEDTGSFTCKCSKSSLYSPEVECTTTKVEAPKDFQKGFSEGQFAIEKVKLERELQYLREMLRSQTSRCESQQVEISRLMYELKVNEDKCNETLKKLDSHLKIFEQLELRPKQTGSSSSYSEKPEKEKLVEAGMSQIPERLERNKNQEEKADSESSSEKSPIELIPNRRRLSVKTSDNESISLRSQSSITKSPVLNRKNELENENQKKAVEQRPKKRFVEQTFLESSDEEDKKSSEVFEGPSFMRGLERVENQKKQGTADDKEVRESLSISPLRFTGRPVTYPTENLSQKENPSSQPTPTSNFSGIVSTPENHSDNKYIIISILWLKLNEEGSVWKDPKIKLLYVDFTFLDVKGEEAETPGSANKPKTPDEKCEFNFIKFVEISDYKKKILQSLLEKPDLDLIVFRVVSDPEDFEEECEDVGVAVVTVKQFVDHCGEGTFLIDVKNINNLDESVGTLAIKVDDTLGIFK